MTRIVTRAQNISRMCLVCGTQNTSGLHAQFLEVEGAELVGIFSVAEEHQSYPGRLHGGISSAILDETIGRAIAITEPDTFGVTVELNVRFKKPVPLGDNVRAIGRITRDSRRVFEGSGEIVLKDGTVAVEATGKYLKMPVEQIADGDFEEEWFVDHRAAASSIDL